MQTVLKSWSHLAVIFLVQSYHDKIQHRQKGLMLQVIKNYVTNNGKVEGWNWGEYTLKCFTLCWVYTIAFFIFKPGRHWRCTLERLSSLHIYIRTSDHICLNKEELMQVKYSWHECIAAGDKNTTKTVAMLSVYLFYRQRI